MSRRSALRAPREDGRIVSEPPLEQAPALLENNHHLLRDQLRSTTLLGRPWLELQKEARQAAVAAACRYLQERDEPLPPNISPGQSPELLVVAGHQPELFHPGVWLKSFALQGLGRQAGAVTLNLIVDNDTIKTTALRVPVRAPTAVRSGGAALQSVPFDNWNSGGPYEEHTVGDVELFDSFAERAGRLLATWDCQPLLPRFWEDVTRQTRRTLVLGDCFAAARRGWERRWGCHNLEVPLSILCQGTPFAWFACHLLAELPRLHTQYNESVARYRAAHHIKSRNHPVPDLARDGDWLESPLWAWRAGQQRRERLFVRRQGARLELRAGQESWPGLPAPHADRAEPTVAAWLELAAEGYKVRTRALTTTLFARLFLADLFVHGIGGGKYDELTDELIRGFYGCEAPPFLVLSGTRFLPLPRAPASSREELRLAQALRDVQWNPQRHEAEASSLPESWRQMAAEKEKWIARSPPAGKEGRLERRERFHILQRLTGSLRGPLAGRAEQLREELKHCRQQMAGNAILERRDYAFCLYPESLLRPFCTQLLSPAD